MHKRDYKETSIMIHTSRLQCSQLKYVKLKWSFCICRKHQNHDNILHTSSFAYIMNCIFFKDLCVYNIIQNLLMILLNERMYVWHYHEIYQWYYQMKERVYDIIIKFINNIIKWKKKPLNDENIIIKRKNNCQNLNLQESKFH
jgi:hypothetical protein